MSTKIGLVGYGPGGEKFHAPFIQAAAGVELAGVVTRSPVRAAEVTDRYGVPVFRSQDEMFDAAPDIEAVAISTPPHTRRALVLEAFAAGRHVVADKPLAPSAAAGRDLVDAAERAGLVLGVYYNRRWDADLLTAADVLRSGRLGDVWRVHSRFDLDEPETVDGGPEGGLLRDLGIHLIDQMVWLLGPVASVDAHLDSVDRPEGPTDASFAVTLHHRSGVASYVSGSKLNGIQQRDLRAYGSRGSLTCESDITDVVDLGRPASGSAAGPDAPPAVSSLLLSDGERLAWPGADGAYRTFYELFGAAVRGEGPPPVPLEEALESLAVLDAALVSAAQGQRIFLPPRSMRH